MKWTPGPCRACKGAPRQFQSDYCAACNKHFQREHELAKEAHSHQARGEK